MKTKLMFFAAFVGLMFFAGCETPSQPYNPGGGGGGGEGGGSGTGTTVQAPKYVQIATSGGSSTIDIQSVLPWTATANKSWISLDPEKGGMGKTEVTITIIAGEQEQGEIDFRASNGYITKMKVYRGAIPEGEDPEGGGEGGEGGETAGSMKCPNLIWFYCVSEGNYSFFISSETPWTIETDADWITFHQTSGEAGEDQCLLMDWKAGHHASATITIRNEKDKVTFPVFRGFIDETNDDYTVKPETKATKIEGCLPHPFRISRTEQVYFSKGNLQYKGGTWLFAPNQYESNMPGNWETPWANTEPMDWFVWGSGNDPLAETAVENNPVDWGVNRIANGGNQPNLWRTLTQEEWLYIAYHRPFLDDLITTGRVEGVPGAIILPDNWDWSKWDGRFQINCRDFDVNLIDNYLWTAMEADGAMFLPATSDAAPYTSSNYIFGTYWSSSTHENAIQVTERDNFISAIKVGNSARCSVRLVRAN